MKKITLLFILLVTLFSVTHSVAQIVAVVGISHDTSEGFTFVATQDITAGTTVRFTDNEYDAAANVFTFGIGTTGEFVVTWNATALVTKGTVLYVKEGAANALTLTCSSGTCGTITWSTNVGVGNGAFSFASDGDSLYAYADTNDDPRDAIGEIYSVMYTDNLTIPANESPLSDWPNAIVTDGFSFPVSGADRIEFAFSPASQRDSRTKVDLENPTNYVSGSSATDLSIVPFTNFNLVGANPVLSIAASPTSVNENSGTGMVYTFTLDAAAVGPITANFNVSGTATFTTDYTQSGAASFNASTGTVTIPNAATSATVTLTPVGDATLEPDETAILTLAAGTGYTAGSPSSATGTILNDDTLAVTPVVAVTGGVHTLGGTEGFSFVALDDISAGSEVFFTENVFDNSLLRFTGAEAVVRWTAPAGGVLRGEVIVATEGPANVFTTTCNSGTCGSVTLISGVFDYASNGEAMFAYTDTDTDHTNGITAISAVLFTGTSTTPGGNIPAGEDPSGVYVGSVVVDGFPASPPIRTEYRFPPERGVTVDQANFQNTANWFHAAAAATLDTTPFANIIIATGSANPTLTLSVAPNTTVEDSGTGMVYTFLLDAPAVGDITVNFTVAGTATFTSDYTQTGAATFAAASGTAVILNGNTSVDVTITPVVDAVVEPQETVELMIASGTGYDGGSPNAATGTITNDDTSNSDPLVAITGMNHVSPDGFSFVAAKDIPAGTTIYFTENEFDNTTLEFGTGEAVLAYTSPGAIVPAGDVIVIKETAPDVFSLTCNGNTGAPCGSIVLVSANLAHDTLGETLYAYEDSDNDPSNGVDDIYAVLFTGLSSGPSGGPIPASQDPSGIYLSALVVDGFPASAPNRTEYRFASGERGIAVAQADFENVANWLHAQANADLSPIPFANISIVDTTPPVITCPLDVTVECGDDTSPANTGTATATDNIDPTPTITFADSSLAGCGLTEVITRTWTATDDAGNSASCVQTITVEDKTQPIITCPADVTVECSDDTSSASTGVAIATDGCGTVTITESDTSVAGCGLTEIITRTWTATDGCGNSTSCVQIITVVDTTNPTIACPADVTVECGDDTSSANTGVATATDGCGTVTITQSETSVAGCGLTETITRTWTATDECGNSTSCTQTITVVDTTNPIIACPGDVTVECGDDTSSASTGVATATDGCGTVTITQSDTSVAGCGLTEIISRTWTATDECGNSTSCVQIITVVDTTNPTIACPADVTVECGDDTSSASTGAATGTDGCGTVTITESDTSVAGCGLTEIITRTWTATDECGNSTSCVQTITVVDTTTPTISCPGDVTVECGDDTTSASTGVATGADGCGTVTISQSDTSVAGCGLTETIIRTWTATDECGNTTSCDQIITVVDSTPPTISCPADVTVECGDDTSSASTGIANGTDGCGTVTITESDSSIAGCGLTEIITRTWTATDECGNSTSCVQIITVVDTTNPTIACPADVTVECGDDTYSTSTGAATGTDGCGTVTITESDTSVAGCGLTEIITRTWTATDECGNSTSCVQTITVVDTTTPTISCPGDVTVECGDDTTSASTGVATGADGCGTVAISQSDTSIAGCGATEIISRTWTATDECGNTITCVQTITVVDTTDPTITCSADITVNTDPGVCEATVIYDPFVGTDTCGVVTITQIAGFASGSSFPVGTTTNTFEATDACGNTAICSFDVTVNDNDPPVANCVAPFTVELDDNGQASIVVADIDNGSSDNCGIDTLVASPLNFDCDDIGSPVDVTLTVTDTSGNISTCVTTVTVEDNIAPDLSVITSPIVLTPPNHSYQTITLAELFVSVSDNCANLSIDDVFISRVTSDEDENGPADGNTVDDIVIAADCESVQLRKERRANGNGRVYTIYITADDGNGNTTTVSAQVHVPISPNGSVIADGVLYEEFCGNIQGPQGIPLDEETDGILDIDDFDILAVDVKFWPNPSDGYFNLKLTSENKSERVTIQVYDPSNKLVHSGEFNMRDEYQFGSELAAGVYIVTITQSGERRSVRAVKY